MYLNPPHRQSSSQATPNPRPPQAPAEPPESPPPAPARYPRSPPLERSSSPSPPAPIAAAIVATPTQVTVAVRKPARITLAEIGKFHLEQSSASTSFQSHWQHRSTQDRHSRFPHTYSAESATAHTPSSARIANRAAFSPSHGTGNSNPNSARLGTVCSTFANPITGLANPCFRVKQNPQRQPNHRRQNHRRQRQPKMLKRQSPDLPSVRTQKCHHSAPHDVQHKHNPLHERLSDPRTSPAARSATTAPASSNTTRLAR